MNTTSTSKSRIGRDMRTPTKSCGKMLRLIVTRLSIYISINDHFNRRTFSVRLTACTCAFLSLMLMLLHTAIHRSSACSSRFFRLLGWRRCTLLCEFSSNWFSERCFFLDLFVNNNFISCGNVLEVGHNLQRAHLKVQPWRHLLACTVDQSSRRDSWLCSYRRAQA